MAKVTVEGIAEWAKVFEENRDLEGYQGQWKDTDGRCTINIIVDDENKTKLEKAGTQRRPKSDDLGRGHVFKFDRRFKTGRDFDEGAPEVYRPDGKLWSYKEDGLIGNGSKILLELDIYKTSKGAGTRIERIKVLDHVKHERVDPFTTDATSQVKDAAPQEMEDEIPF